MRRSLSPETATGGRTGTKLRSKYLTLALFRGGRPGHLKLALLLEIAVLTIATTALGCRERPASARDTVTAQTIPQTVQVKRGPLVSNVIATGVVSSARQAKLSFGTDGTVLEMNVSIGDTVTAGQQLARLSARDREIAVAQAESVVRVSRLKLEQLRQGPSAEMLAAATAGVDAARAKYQELSSDQVLPTQSAVDQAEAAVAAAQARLDQLKLGPADTELQTAQANESSARAAVDLARSKLEVVKQGSTQAQWAEALAAVDQARARLKLAEVNLADVKAGPRELDLLQAQQAVDATKANLTGALERLYLAKMGDPRAPASISVSQAEMDVVAAQTACDTALSALNVVKSRPSPSELQTAQSEYDSAKAAFDAATVRVDQMKRGATPEDVRQAESEVASAEALLTAAQARLNQVTAGPTKTELLTAESDLASAKAALAKAKLEQAKAGPNSAEAQAALSALTSAQAQLALVKAGPSATELALAEEEANQAAMGLEKARLDLQSTSLVAPFDGVITAVGAGPGSFVRYYDPVLTVTDPKATRIDVTVSENDLPRIRPGQPASVSIAALGQPAIPGRVLSVVPSGMTQQKGIAYLVTVGVDSPETTMPVSMSATATIETGRKENVLLVPNPALHGTEGSRSVDIMVNGTREERTVQTGLASSDFTEVVSGLNEGELVVMQPLTASLK